MLSVAFFVVMLSCCHDTQHNETQNIEIWHNYTQPDHLKVQDSIKDAQHNNMLSVVVLSIIYAQCHFFIAMLSVVMQSGRNSTQRNNTQNNEVQHPYSKLENKKARHSA